MARSYTMLTEDTPRVIGRLEAVFRGQAIACTLLGQILSAVVGRKLYGRFLSFQDWQEANLSESGEKGNGDHLIMIEAPRVATSYAIQAILIFDYLHFAGKMNALEKPITISGTASTWFAKFYVADSYPERDRLLFSP